MAKMRSLHANCIIMDTHGLGGASDGGYIGAVFEASDRRVRADGPGHMPIALQGDKTFRGDRGAVAAGSAADRAAARSSDDAEGSFHRVLHTLDLEPHDLDDAAVAEQDAIQNAEVKEEMQAAMTGMSAAQKEQYVATLASMARAGACH